VRLLFAAAVLSFATLAHATGQEQLAVDYLEREVPRWSTQNHCFSCHNNGDGARALYLAGRRGYPVSASALRETTNWLLSPKDWDSTRVNPGFSDKKLARIQFAAALTEAVLAGIVSEPSAILRAAELLVADQRPDGAFPIDTGGIAGAPATYGTSLATYLARRTLEVADRQRFADPIGRADQWFESATPENIPDTAAVLLARPHSAAVRAKTLDRLLAAQTSDGGWGPQPRAPAEVFDTGLVLLALHAAGNDSRSALAVEQGRALLRKLQLPDGSWLETTRPSGFTSYAERISTAAWATYALIETRQ
jgi:hypothetical protein